MPSNHETNLIADAAVRYHRFDELRGSVDLGDGSWLTEAEYSELRRFRDESRRETWLFGRWAAKSLIQDQFAVSPPEAAEIEILSRDADGRAVRPTVRIAGRPAVGCLSITHSSQAVLAALSLQADCRVGVDLSAVERVGGGFVQTWFTPGEQGQIAQDERRAALFWAVKEAVYKACNEGESFVPQKIEVQCEADEVYCCRYGNVRLSAPDIRVWTVDGQIAVLVTYRRAERLAWTAPHLPEISSQKSVVRRRRLAALGPPNASRWLAANQ